MKFDDEIVLVRMKKDGKSVTHALSRSYRHDGYTACGLANDAESDIGSGTVDKINCDKCLTSIGLGD